MPKINVINNRLSNTWVLRRQTREKEKQLWMEKLRGREFTSVWDISQGAAAFEKLTKKRHLTAVDLDEVLKRVTEPPPDGWDDWYWEAPCGEMGSDPYEEEKWREITDGRDNLIKDVKRYMVNHPAVPISSLLDKWIYDPQVGREAEWALWRRRGELDSRRDFPLILKLPHAVDLKRYVINYWPFSPTFLLPLINDPQIRQEAEQLRLRVAQDQRTPEDLLIELLKDRHEMVATAARDNPVIKGKLPELLKSSAIAFAELNQAVRASLIKNWPKDAPFLPERLNPVFPLELSGYRSTPFRYLGSSEEVGMALKRIRFNEQAYMPDGEYVLADNPLLQRDLALCRYHFPGFLIKYSDDHVISAEKLLAWMRARKAFGNLEKKARPSYHDLAFLYYSLKHGSSTLGSEPQREIICDALVGLKSRMISCPRILVLGFSSIYSLENLLVLLFLMGFRRAQIFALDLSEEPLLIAQKYPFPYLWGYDIHYIQGDAMKLPFSEKGFDLAVTHLLLTHIQDDKKERVFKEVGRVLAEEGEFLDEEIIVPPGVNQGKYRWFYRTLGEEYPGSAEERQKAAEYMEQLGSYSVFYPYVSPKTLGDHLSRSGLEGKPNESSSKRPRFYDGVYAATYQIRAKK